jgi:hypothetical protein
MVKAIAATGTTPRVSRGKQLKAEKRHKSMQKVSRREMPLDTKTPAGKLQYVKDALGLTLDGLTSLLFPPSEDAADSDIDAQIVLMWLSRLELPCVDVRKDITALFRLVRAWKARMGHDRDDNLWENTMLVEGIVEMGIESMSGHFVGRHPAANQLIRSVRQNTGSRKRRRGERLSKGIVEKKSDHKDAILALRLTPTSHQFEGDPALRRKLSNKAKATRKARRRAA